MRAVDPIGKAPRRTAGHSVQAIVAAATEEFSERGLDAAKIDSIAVRAGVSSQLIFHYFGSKDALYQEVLKGIAEADTDFVERGRFDELDPMAALTRYIELSFDASEMSARITIDQVLHNGRQISGRNPVRVNTRRLIDALDRILERGRAQAVVAPDIKGEELYIIINTIGFSNAAFSPLAMRMIAHEASRSEASDWRRYCLDFIMRSVRP